MRPNHTVLRRAALSGPEGRQPVLDRGVFSLSPAQTLLTNFWPSHWLTNFSYMDCVSNALEPSWFPVTSYRWNCLACCAHQRLLFHHIHKFLSCKDVRPSKRSLFHCPHPPACHSCLPLPSAVSGANLIFTNNCLVFETFQIRRTGGSGYINTLKELPCFKEEPVVIWLIQIIFADHGLYSENGCLVF